jgi:hypothetical protein
MRKGHNKGTPKVTMRMPTLHRQRRPDGGGWMQLPVALEALEGR